MPTLTEIRNQRLKRELPFEPNRSSMVGTIERAEKVFDMSLVKGISTDDADAEILIGEVIDSTKRLDDSPIYKNVDALIDVFDPSEPPTGKKLTEDPLDNAAALAEMVKAEIDIVRPFVKFGLKAAAYLFSPVDRAFKFMTNAAMYEPLTKSVVRPVRRHAILAARDRVYREKVLNPRMRGKIVTPKEEKQVIDDLNKQTTAAIKQLAGEDIESVEVADFLQSGKDALKALVPWPGFADDVKSTGEIAADSYGRIVGREAPWYYAPVTDLAQETAAMTGLLKIAQSAQVTKDTSSIAKAVKLTKAEVKAIKKLHKAASQVRKTPAKSLTVPSPTEAATVTQKLIRLIKEAKPLRDKKALLLHRDRQRKAQKLATVQKNIRGKGLVGATKGALKGKSPLPDFTPINVDLTSQEIDALFNLINTSQLGVGFDKGRAFLSLDKLLKGNLITKSEIANLEAVFGKGLTKALFGKQSISSIIQDVSFEIINLPRAILASYDLSAAGRQGIIFSVSHPIASMTAFGRSVRAATSLKYADDIERITKSSRFGKLADRFGIHSSPTGFAAKIGAKEEVYMSRIAEKIPGIAASERAFTTFLNQQRREVFAIQARKWIKRGITPFGKKKSLKEFGDIIIKGKKLTRNQKGFFQYAKFVNHGTGRGSLENLQPGALTALNATFFSPRFQVSRFQVVGDLISPKTTALARKAIARDLAEFYITGMGIMAMAKAGGAEVETDPRSSDFGKIKVGNTRYNYWGAFQPLATLAGRIYMGEIKSTGTGKIKKKERISLGIDNTVISFLRTKLAPVPGRGFDILVSETILGEPVEPTAKFALKTAYETLVPLFIQDSVDAWRFQGMDAQLPISAGLAFTGIGVQTWELAPFAELELAKDSLARQTYGKNYDQLSFDEVAMLDGDILINHPGIMEMEQEAKFESNSVRFLMKQAQELRKSERFLNKKINKDLLADLNEMKLRLGGVDRVFGNWRLNDEQYKEYQERVADNINKLFEETKTLWDTKDIDSFEKIALASALLRNAKLLAADEMKIGSME